MKNLRFGLVASMVLLSWGCTPTVSTHSTPRGPKVKAFLTKAGNDTLISLSVQRRDDAPSWKVAFPDEQPLDLFLEDISGQTIVRWKMDADRLKASSIKPYKLNLMSNGNTYSTTVSFRTTSHQIASDAVEAVIIQLL
jgi:hypothetical protein